MKICENRRYVFWSDADATDRQKDNGSIEKTIFEVLVRFIWDFLLGQRSLQSTTVDDALQRKLSRQVGSKRLAVAFI